ncbi:hypothetical protein [Sediminicoccus sp. BL-A-41-H5]|uniref:hypothetical protein n=1 Tax=Sediminicoccus sp. BL-A-41-H5 TaxID=3421106 RepID=UPI003D673FB0
MLGLTPRQGQAQTVSCCQGRLIGASFHLGSRVLSPASAELRYNMVLQNPGNTAINCIVRFPQPSSSGGQINRLMTLGAGQQQVVLLGIETMHPDLAGDVMRDYGPRFMVGYARVECGG